MKIQKTSARWLAVVWYISEKSVKITSSVVQAAQLMNFLIIHEEKIACE